VHSHKKRTRTIDIVAVVAAVFADAASRIVVAVVAVVAVGAAAGTAGLECHKLSHAQVHRCFQRRCPGNREKPGRSQPLIGKEGLKTVSTQTMMMPRAH